VLCVDSPEEVVFNPTPNAAKRISAQNIHAVRVRKMAATLFSQDFHQEIRDIW